MKITNTTKIPNDKIREIISFVRPSGISNFDVMIKNSGDSSIAGRAYTSGNCSYHATNDPFVVCRIPKPEPKTIHGFKGSIDNPVTWIETNYPKRLHTYQIGHLKGRRYWIANQIEALVYVLAHELRHIWQAKMKNKKGYYPKSRGRFSEIDTEGFAITKLRAWRKLQSN
jgi:hypothetical protein